jgi:hypothetical protein
MEQFTKASGTVSIKMVSESKCGPMELGMKDFGFRTKLMAKGNFGMQMVIHTKVSGKKTKQMAMEYTRIRMGRSMRDTGRMINSTDLAKRLG